MSKKFDLVAINGRAKTHTFDNIAQIESICAEYDKRMFDAGLLKRELIGARLLIYSGSPVNSAYLQKCKSCIVQNKAIAIRGVTKWRIESITRVESWPEMLGHRSLTLTDSQRVKIMTTALTRLDSR